MCEEHILRGLNKNMRIAIGGCCHGELDQVYASIMYIQQQKKIKIDLLLICGDFQVLTIPVSPENIIDRNSNLC